MIRSRKAEPIGVLKLVARLSTQPLTSEAGWDGCPGFGLEDILGLALRIDQYRCYHAVGRTRRQRTAISLVPCASIKPVLPCCR
jgi:hypothetical protein